MKKLILCAFALAAFGVSHAQKAQFGIKAGADVATSVNKFENFFASGRQTTTETGFFVGGFVDISLSQKVHVQPELLYTKIQDLEFIHLPIVFKYAVAKEFDLVAGPSLGFLFNKDNSTNPVNVGIDAGFAINLDSHFILDAKYSFGLANLDENGGNNSTTLSGLFIGLGYRF